MNSYLHYLPLFDQIIVLGNAEHMTNCNTIIASGNFADIERDFGSLVHHSGEDERFPDDYLEDKPLLKKASSERKDQSGDSVLLSSSKMNAGKQLFIKEDRQIGKVEAGAYLQYFNSASDNHGKRWMFFTLFIYGIAQILKNCGDFWLLFWAQDSVKKSHSLGYWIWTNALWIILLAVALVFRSIVFVNLATNASQNLHDSIFRALLSASIPNFFDVTPIGQILNRFSKDLDNVDVMLPDFLSQTLFNTFVIISALIVTIIGSPYVLLIILPTLYVFVWIRGFFSKSSREIKRIEAISRSPIFSMFAETLNGLSTIRAFNQTEIFSKMNKSIIGRNARAFLTTVNFFRKTYFILT
jgi:ABC-type multidrug transport system fused ATPase/permease subunit